MKNKAIKIIAIICIVIVVLFPVGVFLITNEVVIVWFASLFTPTPKLKNVEKPFSTNGVYTYVLEEHKEEMAFSKIVLHIYQASEKDDNTLKDSRDNRYAIDFTFYDYNDSPFYVSFLEYGKKSEVLKRNEGTIFYRYSFTFELQNLDYSLYLTPIEGEKIGFQIIKPFWITPKFLDKESL